MYRQSQLSCRGRTALGELGKFMPNNSQSDKLRLCRDFGRYLSPLSKPDPFGAENAGRTGDCNYVALSSHRTISIGARSSAITWGKRPTMFTPLTWKALATGWPRNDRPAVTDALLKVPAALATSIRLPLTNCFSLSEHEHTSLRCAARNIAIRFARRVQYPNCRKGYIIS